MYEMLGDKHPFYQSGDSISYYAAALKKPIFDFPEFFSE